MADKAIAELHEEHPEIPIMPVNPVVEQTPKEEEIEIPVKPGIFTRMLAMCIKTNETFTLKVNVVSKTLVDVMSNEEGEPEPAARLALADLESTRPILPKYSVKCSARSSCTSRCTNSIHYSYNDKVSNGYSVSRCQSTFSNIS